MSNMNGFSLRTSAINTHQQVESLKQRFWIRYQIGGLDFEDLIKASYKSPQSIVEFIENFEIAWQKSKMEFRAFLEKISPNIDRQTEQDIRNDERNKTIKDVCRAVHEVIRPVLQNLDVIGPEDTSTLTMCRMIVDEYRYLENAMQTLRDADNEEIAALNREIRRLKGDDEIPF